MKKIVEIQIIVLPLIEDTHSIECKNSIVSAKDSISFCSPYQSSITSCPCHKDRYIF